jgi:hypothetical protein
MAKGKKSSLAIAKEKERKEDKRIAIEMQNLSANKPKVKNYSIVNEVSFLPKELSTIKMNSYGVDDVNPFIAGTQKIQPLEVMENFNQTEKISRSIESLTPVNDSSSYAGLLGGMANSLSNFNKVDIGAGTLEFNADKILDGEASVEYSIPFSSGKRTGLLGHFFKKGN